MARMLGLNASQTSRGEKTFQAFGLKLTITGKV
jgi:hypothetical protein